MELTVQNFRGISNATMPLHPKMTLIGGQVGAGKTSMIQALQALLTDQAIPIEGMKKKDAKALVRKGAKSGYASLTWKNKQSEADNQPVQLPESSKAEVYWPKLEKTGDQFLCSPYAAGILTPAKVSPKELTQIIGVLPTKEDFLTEQDMMKTVYGISDEQIEKLWSNIQKSGWDVEQSRIEEIGRGLKRDWEKLAGQNWGVNIAKEFKPEHYVDQTPAELDLALKTAEKIYEHTIKSQAIDEKVKEELQKLETKLNDGSVQKLIDISTQELEGVNAELSKAQALMKELPAIVNDQQAYECDKSHGGCGMLGVIKDGKLQQAPDPNKAKEDASALRARVAEQGKIIQELQEKRDTIVLSIRECKSLLVRCEDAKKQLNQVVLDAPAPGVSIEDAKAEVELSRKRIAAYKICAECHEIKDLLFGNEFLSGWLSPAGVRRQVLVQKLATFNELLSIICETAGWPEVKLDDDLEIRFNDFPYVLISTGQQFAVNVVLQIAITRLDGSQIIVIDGIQVLGDLEDGLLNMLANFPIPSVLGYTYKQPNELRQLNDHGKSYWVAEERQAKQLVGAK